MPARKLHPGIDQTGGVPYVIRHTTDGREIRILVPQNIDQARIASTIAQSGDVPVDDRLMDLYARLWPKIGALLKTNAGFSAPLLCRETGAYRDAQVRLIVVGQQTRSWLQKGPWREDLFSSKANALNAIQTLMREYADFLVMDREKGRGFFRAARQIQRAIDPGSGDNIAFLWRNLFICDQNGREPPVRHSMCTWRYWKHNRRIRKLGVTLQTSISSWPASQPTYANMRLALKMRKPPAQRSS